MHVMSILMWFLPQWWMCNHVLKHRSFHHSLQPVYSKIEQHMHASQHELVMACWSNFVRRASSDGRSSSCCSTSISTSWSFAWSSSVIIVEPSVTAVNAVTLLISQWAQGLCHVTADSRSLPQAFQWEIFANSRLPQAKKTVTLWYTTKVFPLW